MEDQRVADIRRVVGPLLEEQGIELVDLFTRPQGRQYSVCFIVHAVGGVTIQRCAKVNRLIRQALEEAHLLGEYETVEVSSPGLDRPLKQPRDFERALGEKVHVHIQEADRIRELDAMVLAVQADAVVLKTAEENVTVPLNAIIKATKVLPW
jgi:ribosome maturation factor RimP